jgi:hypothetical protein
MTVLDRLLSDRLISCQIQPLHIGPDELVHVVGSQEPIRDQPGDRARLLLNIGWLTVESIQIELPEAERLNLVSALQQAARAWLKSTGDASSEDREQVRWVAEKTRSRESNQQIAQRVWLAAALYGLGHRGLAFDQEGRIRWEGGLAGRIGLSPNDAIDLAWEQGNRQTYTASFRQPDGTITRGKGRNRWNIYRLTLAPEAAFLFERRAKTVRESVALIVASETFATQPQLPRDFYGGDAFQQACIDAQDQQFTHILVLSPAHGVISLDDMVPSEESWDNIADRKIWPWQIMATQRLGSYLFGEHPEMKTQPVNWWSWLSPDSQYEFTVFGGGFAVRILLNYLAQTRTRMPTNWPQIVLMEQRPGYDVGDTDEDFDFEFDLEEDFEDEDDYPPALDDIEQLLESATELVDLVNVYVLPINETWELAPDEALIPVRLLTETGMDIEDLLDLLTDMNLLLEQPLPISMIINAGMAVSVMIQITHGLVHDERDTVQELLDVFPEGVLRQYVENLLQEPALEDRLCACLALAEQLQLLALAISPAIRDQLLIWLQTYVATKMRQRLLGNGKVEEK